MTDDLVKRLRGGLPCGDVKCVERSAAGGCTCGEAASRIEKLEMLLHGEKCLRQDLKDTAEAHSKQQRDRIEKLEAALRVYADEDHWSGDTFEPIMFPEGECKCCYEHFSDQGEIARKALEGKDE